MKQEWLKLAARFQALARRERAMVAGVLLAGLPYLGYSLLIEPQLARRAAFVQRIVQSRAAQAGIVAQLAGMQAQLSDPDAANRAALEQTRAGIAALDAKLAGMSGSLVPPEQMQAFLESLLSKNHHLELLTLRTLPPTPLIEAATPVDNKGGGKTSVAKPATSAPNVYKHGVEIRIAGSYNDLLTYLAALERLPQRILWNRITLDVDKYPRNVMTLTVYTLSLDKQWLVL